MLEYNFPSAGLGSEKFILNYLSHRLKTIVGIASTNKTDSATCILILYKRFIRFK